MRRFPLLLGALLLPLVAAAPASADRLVIRGAGWGHGVGMSQYGAYGQALEGRSHRQILGHYYSGTELGQASGAKRVRVLLQSSSTMTFSGARRAGTARLSPARTYVASASGGRVVVSSRGRRVATLPAPLQVRGPSGVRLSGVNGGRYRGALEVRPGSVVNEVSLEDYVRGVVANESPASWPIEALKAQAVAARTYAITTEKSGLFDHYADVRSQVYRGIASETASTDAAVRATRGELVTDGGTPVVTYFFSTSGGQTEDVENVFGGPAQSHLRGVRDPWDRVSPRHRWGPVSFTLAQAGAKLSGLVRGSFRRIEVTRRGSSPRIVTASVVGTGGRTTVSGATLRARFGLYDSWAYFDVR